MLHQVRHTTASLRRVRQKGQRTRRQPGTTYTLSNISSDEDGDPCVPAPASLFCNLFPDNANPIVDVWVRHNELGKKTLDVWILNTEELLQMACDAVNLGKCLAVGGFKMQRRYGVLSALPIHVCVQHCPPNNVQESRV